MIEVTSLESPREMTQLVNNEWTSLEHARKESIKFVRTGPYKAATVMEDNRVVYRFISFDYRGQIRVIEYNFKHGAILQHEDPTK